MDRAALTAFRPASTLLFFAVAGCAGGEESATGDAAGPVALDGAVVFPEDFGAVQTVRELDDGTVLVADPLGGALYRVDMDAETRTQVGSEGQGPQEYRQPDAVWPLPGDSTLLVDLGNGRLVALGPDLGFGDTSPLSSGDPRSGSLRLLIPRAVDAQGRIYIQSSGGGMGSPTLPDSGSVLRVHRGSATVDTVARYKLTDRIRSESGGPDNRSVSIEQVPLSTEDAWGVAPDGSVVLARAGDYHVEWHAPDGTVTAGPPVSYEPVPIGQEEKEAWARGQSRGGGGLSVRVMVNDAGAMQTSFSRGGGGGGGEEPDLDRYQWPEVKPPFYGDAILVDPLGRAWVRRHVEAGADATYDVFDGSGHRVATYTLEGNREVVGFGDGVVYAVSFDDFDLSYLERYTLPG